MTTPDYLSLVPPWRVEPAREIVRTRIFTLHSRRCTSATDPRRSGDFVYLQCPDWVNTIAITPDRRVVMIEQFRYGLAGVTLEIPGGVVDTGETPDETCRRELLEETGYAGDAAAVIGVVSANPSMQDNRVHTAVVRNARRVADLALDPDEEIAVRLVPLDEIPGLIRSGVIHHAFVVAAFHHLSMTPP